MAAAVLSRTTNDAPHSQSKMSSPKDSKRNLMSKTEDPPARTDIIEDSKPATTTNAQPLAPPPRPSQNGANGEPDYFNQLHSGNTQFSLEPNPFEQSFGNPSTETPGKAVLPPVASITSPSIQTPGWGSLRSGPLSPAMLTGPQGATDYFSESFRTGFPTPNESSLRTGLTPGGTGSMFPQPSPNSQAIFNLQSSGATPGTLDFHRTALSAAQAQQSKFNLPPTSAAATQALNPSASAAALQITQAAAPVQRVQEPAFTNHDVNTAANDLLQFSSGARNGFAVPTQPNHVTTNLPAQGQMSQESSPTARRNTKGSIATSVSGSVEPADHSESGNSEESKPIGRTRNNNNNKRASNAKVAPNASKARKASDSAVKPPPSKKMKASNVASSIDMDMDDDDDDMSDDDNKDELNANGKKMTDEDKRKNFLERNRIAALKCRQRKKQWLSNLQSKVELFSTENDALSAQVTQLREEVVNLKTLLLAHKDCPVSQAQGIGGMAMTSFIGDIQPHHNPYGFATHQNGMAMQMGGPQGPGPMQRT